MFADWELITISLVLSTAAGVWWAWHYWAFRSWRTLAVFVIAGLLVGVALAWSSNGVFIALPIAGIALWFVASGNKLLLSMPRQEYLYAERWREADEEARRVMTDRGNASPQAIAALDKVIASLSDRPPHEDWEPARVAKVEELTLARAILMGADPSPDALDRLRARRTESLRLFLDARRARSSFWGTP